MSYWNPKKPSINELRRQIVGDSKRLDALMTKLIRQVRNDERAKTIEDLSKARAIADERQDRPQ